VRQDETVNNSGPLPGIAVAITSLLSYGVFIAGGLIGLLGAALTRGRGRAIFLTLVLCSAMVPLGVLAGTALGKSGIIPRPPPTAPPAVPTIGEMTLDLDGPVPIHVTGSAECNRRDGAYWAITELNSNHDWEVEWLGRNVTFRPQTYPAIVQGGAASVERALVAVEDFEGHGITYFHEGSLPATAGTVAPDGSSGEVALDLIRETPGPGKEGLIAPEWPQTLSGHITWSCDTP
jgi:hypothetical protein